MAVIELEHKYIDGSVCYRKYAGTGDDDKPTGGDIATGSLFIDVDNGDEYLYDSEGEMWNKKSGSGGGGDSGGGALLIEIAMETTDDENVYTADKTAREIIDAFPLVYVKVQVSEGGLTGTFAMPALDDEDVGPDLGFSYVYVEEDMPSAGFSAGYNFTLPYYLNNVWTKQRFVAPTLDDYPTYISDK